MVAGSSQQVTTSLHTVSRTTVATTSQQPKDLPPLASSIIRITTTTLWQISTVDAAQQIQDAFRTGNRPVSQPSLEATTPTSLNDPEVASTGRQTMGRNTTSQSLDITGSNDTLLSMSASSAGNVELTTGRSLPYTPNSEVPQSTDLPGSTLKDSSSQSSGDAEKKTPLIAGTAAGVAVALILGALLIWFLLRHWKNKSDSSQVPEKTRTILSFHDDDQDKTWEQFQSESPTAEKRSDRLKKSLARPDTECTVVPVQEAMADYASSDLSSSETIQSGNGPGLFSHFREVVPPPSMRSKRISGTTTHTAKSHYAPTVGTAIGTVHTLDSQVQLPYPPPRPPSSSFSIATVQPTADNRSSWAPSYVQPNQATSSSRFDTAEASPLPSQGQSLATTPTISRRSTMTDISLGAVGSSGRYIGMAL